MKNYIKTYIYFEFPWMIDDAKVVDWIRDNIDRRDYRLRIKDGKIKGVSVTPEVATIIKLTLGLKPKLKFGVRNL